MHMHPIKSLQDFQMIIDNQWPLCHTVNGIVYNISLMAVLNMKMLDVMEMIHGNKLFYSKPRN